VVDWEAVVAMEVVGVQGDLGKKNGVGSVYVDRLR
jgi:hypothetical protein